ncbi:isocitrate lyase family protein [Ochrobactrum quorumnocens]|uniref:Isocitrate lyase family protein n=1 Tax=Ochrobactrum quorumnocens TaxID=271865 RepID=A0A248UE08_9HYPH|nr:isocitrate lyase/PEP mutase family protein [[Ochrobactrum] quorumnocens]ASV84894.1 isocitrate lyase family protein [[Ochrobactrum] quorumnocens]
MNVSEKTNLRQRLDEPGAIYMPGCYDALSAKLIESAGFEAAAISGFALEGAHLGGPDIGLMTLTELVEQSARITDAVNIPVIADVDTGFGGVQNIHRTVRLAERAGLSGIHLEDQTLPKKCPLLPGRKVVALQEAKDRYAVALEARSNTNFIIIARTDADIIGYDEQIMRANEYLATGVDCVLPMMIELNGASFHDLPPDKQMRHIERVVTDIDGHVMYVGPPPGGYTAFDLGAIGVKLISLSAGTINAAATAMMIALGELKSTGRVSLFQEKPERLEAGSGLLQFLGVDFYLDLERRFVRD